MRVSIGPFKNWIGPYQIAEWLTTFTVNGIGDEDDITFKLIKDPHQFGNWLAGGDEGESMLMKACEWIQSKRQRKVKIHIDKYDTWNMDGTMALIILPMLKQLQATKHGGPFTDDEDVPDELKSTSAAPKENDWDTDSNHFKRWDWIMDEMIWTFEQLQPDCDWEAQYTITPCKLDMSDYPEDEGKLTTPVRWTVKGEYDFDGMKKHQERISNGLKLFGKYFQALWD